MIDIRYKCKCMAGEATVQVLERPTGSDLLLWMGVVQATIGMDHGARNPKCRSETMEYAKIPVDENAGGIGEKPQLN